MEMIITFSAKNKIESRVVGGIEVDSEALHREK